MSDNNLAQPQPRYAVVETGSESFPFMVRDNQRAQTVPGSSVTNMEAAKQHAHRLNSLPLYFAGQELETNMWCVKQYNAKGPRCSERFTGPDAQQQAEAKALEMNQAEGLLLPEPVTEVDIRLCVERGEHVISTRHTAAECPVETNLCKATHPTTGSACIVGAHGSDRKHWDGSITTWSDDDQPQVDELADALASLDRQNGFTTLSYQEQAAFILKRLGSL